MNIKEIYLIYKIYFKNNYKKIKSKFSYLFVNIYLN
jgi:hypothetical protein